MSTEWKYVIIAWVLAIGAVPFVIMAGLSINNNKHIAAGAPSRATHNETMSARAGILRSAATAQDSKSTYYASLVNIIRQVERNHATFRDFIEQNNLEQTERLLAQNRKLYRNLFKIREIRTRDTPKTPAYNFVNCLNYADDQSLSNRIVGVVLDPETDICFEYLDRFKETIEGHYFYY